jgi:hypothetical protein
MLNGKCGAASACGARTLPSRSREAPGEEATRRDQFVGTATQGSGLLTSRFRYFDSSFLRMRRSSMKHSPLTEHNTDPNMIITIVSIGRGLLPRCLIASQAHAAGAPGVGHAACAQLTKWRQRIRPFLVGDSRPGVACGHATRGRTTDSVPLAYSNTALRVEPVATENGSFAIARITRIVPAAATKPGATESSLRYWKKRCWHWSR